MEVIISHVHLDLDGFASMILAKKLHPLAILVLSGDVSDNLKELINFYRNEFDIHKASDIKPENINKIVMVDTSNFNRIGKFSILEKNLNIELIIYDHHTKQGYGANSTLLLEKIFEKNIELSKLEATIALMGIYEDTGNFSFKNTSYLDMECGAKLLKIGANLETVIQYVSKSLTQHDLDFLLILMKNGEILEINHHKIFITFYESDTYYNGIDVLINKIMELEGSEACFIITGNTSRASIIGRSTTEKIPVNKILESFSSGGHIFAGSGMTKNKEFIEIKYLLLNSLNNNVLLGKLAKDIMKSPVKTVEPESKLKDVLKLISRFGYSGLPVVKDGQLLGIISRRDVEKTVSHGFGNAPIKAYMTKNLVVGKLHSTLDDIKILMVENEVSRIPIVENNKLLGIITRSDLLEGLYNEKSNRSPSISKKPTEFYFDYIKKIPKQYEIILKEIEKLANQRLENCYLVGGIVRDLLLGIENLDLDIVVEGDALSFGAELAKNLDISKIVNHETFRTCIIILKNGLNIDIASSRIEYYEYPTSLPTVDIGNIKEDLYRRDFTINSMAVKLNFGEFGKLIDYYGGYSDLQAKKIRILHNLSFIEDPTRIIRAIRFAVRYDFNFEDETFNFMTQAINDGFLNNLSWQRFKNELIIMLKEKSFEKALDYLIDLKIIEKIHPNIKIDNKTRTHLIEINNFKEYFEDLNIESWLLYLLVILENLDREQLNFIFKRFTFNEDFVKKYNFGKKIRLSISEEIVLCNKNSEIYEICHQIPKEILAIIFIEYKISREKIEIYFNRIIKTKPLVNGKTLINLGLKPSELFKNYLNKIYKIQLDNSKLSKDDLIELWRKVEGEI